jgi:ferrochelatase
MSKTAVVLFNLGGPDRPEAVRPFLFNLFNDPAIIGLPRMPRWLLAQFISRRRAPVAREIYAKLGGGSPLLANTEAQAQALQAALADLGELRVFIAMRYWHPMTEQTVREVAAYGPDRIVLLPLYPQFSTTTSASSLAAWEQAAKAAGLTMPTRSLCCYPTEPGFIAEVAESLREAIVSLESEAPPRVLFSAHGLPKKIVARGDPYPWQVDATADAVAAALGETGLDWRVCYQSRVGPLEWIGPATDQEIEQAGKDRVPLVVVPIAFVSEHSETLVELDLEYAELARASGVPAYVRVRTVDDGARFIGGLAGLVRAALQEDLALRSQSGGRICPGRWGRCPNRLA